MLIFKPELADKILRRQKTQLRRVVRPGKAGAQPRCRFIPGAPELLARKLLETELTEQERTNVQHHRGQWPTRIVGTVEIAAVRREPLGEITADDARREGWRSIVQFKRDWVRRQSALWVRLRPDITDAEIVERFDTTWATRDVWVITFELVASTMLLAADPRRSGDYVPGPHNIRGERVAMADEREAVDPAIIDSWATDPSSTHSRIKAAIAAHGSAAADQRALDTRLLDIEERARRARRKAHLSSINISSELRAFHAAQARHKSAQTIEERLRSVESKAYREGTRNAA